jgi:2-polyprenyl-3-methyl-5-hydroxy-6-metoxy-1,4-benzoquinol methylase
MSVAPRIAGRLKRAVRTIVTGPTAAEQALVRTSAVATLVARQFDTAGYRRLDLFVIYCAIADAEGAGHGGLNLLEKLLRADPVQRNADLALLALLRRGPLSASLFIPAATVIDPDLRVVSNLSGLATALYYGDAQVRVTVWKSRRTPTYDADWFASHGFTPAEIDRIEAARIEVYEKLGIARLPWPVLAGIHEELRRHLDSHDPMHGLGGFYQSCEDLVIEGQRPTAVRFNEYRLGSVLNPGQRLLDIGCNCGFLSLHCAPFVKGVDGFDINPRFIEIANAAKRHLGRQNCQFSTSTFDDFCGTGPYDVIFSFAVHHWIGQPITVYARRLQQMLKPEGMILLESQDLTTHDADWDAKLAAFCSAGFEPLRSGTLCDDGVRARRHVLLRNTHQP